MPWKPHFTGDRKNCVQKPEFCPTQQFTCISKILHLIYPLHIWSCLLLQSFFCSTSLWYCRKSRYKKQGNTIWSSRENEIHKQSVEDKTFDASGKYIIGTRTKLFPCRIRLKIEKTFFCDHFHHCMFIYRCQEPIKSE